MKEYIRDRWGKRVALGLWSPGVLVALALGFMLMVFAPMEVYLNNQSEFWYDAGLLLPWCLLYFGIAFFGCMLLFAVLWSCGERVYNIGLAVSLWILTGCYVQGNFGVKNLPAMDGADFVLGEYRRELIFSRINFVSLWGESAAFSFSCCF